MTHDVHPGTTRHCVTRLERLSTLVDASSVLQEERDLLIRDLYAHRGLSLRQLAGITGLSHVRVWQIVKRDDDNGGNQ